MQAQSHSTVGDFGKKSNGSGTNEPIFTELNSAETGHILFWPKQMELMEMVFPI